MKRIAPFCILLAGILWGCIGLFVRHLNEAGLFAMEIVTLRAFVTCVVIGIYLFVFDRSLLKIKIKDIWCFLGTGFCSIVFFNFCYFKAMSITSLSVAAVLLYTAPAMVMLMSSVLFRETLTIRKIVSVLLTFIGCVFVTGLATGSNTLNGIGILIGLGAGFGYALYSIFGKYAIMRGYNSLTITFYTFLFATVGSLLFADMRTIGMVVETDITAIGWVIALGLFSTVIPYLTYTYGLQSVENGKASIIASIEPVTATVLGGLFFHEHLSILNLIGIVVVLVALYICNTDS